MIESSEHKKETETADLIDGGASDTNKHGKARELVDAALRARRNGEDDRADLLMEQARRTDPQAVEDNLMESAPGSLSPDGEATGGEAQDDREVALISRQIQPGSGAPSRAGITDAGSGADS